MKIISNNQDLSLNFDILSMAGEDMSLDMFEKFNITVYTQDPNIQPQIMKNDLGDEVLSIGSDILSELPDGQISLKFEWAFVDETYNDGTYDTKACKHLDYYLRNDTQNISGNSRDYYTKEEIRNMFINLDPSTFVPMIADIQQGPAGQDG